MEIKKITLVECVIPNTKNIYTDITIRYNTDTDIMTIVDSDHNELNFYVNSVVLDRLETAMNTCYQEAWTKENN